MSAPEPLAATALRRPSDPAAFPFELTSGLEDLPEGSGQERALEAVALGVDLRRPGFNLFVLGPAGIGKRELVGRLLERRARSEPVPDDWCYVNDFDDPRRPHALRLPQGAGARLRDAMRQLVDELQSAIPAAFESEEYRARVEQVDAEFNELQERALVELAREAERKDVALLRTPAGFSLAPARDGRVMDSKDFDQLPDAEKERIAQAISATQEGLEKVLRQMAGWRKAHRERIRELNREVTTFAVGSLVNDVVRQHAALPEVVRWLQAMQKDVIDNAEIFLKRAEAAGPLPLPVAAPAAEELPPTRRYQVNLLVGGSEAAGAPVVFEGNPTTPNLVGRVEYLARFGALLTDFGLIKAGALHRANGGYLMLEVQKLFMQPLAWEALKRALTNRVVRIESLGEAYGLISTVTLEPEPVPLDVKVVLFGERLHYYLLQALDPDFGDLFKVAADFEDDVPRTADAQLQYARLVATLARRASLLPFHREAVARLVDQGARLAGDGERLSLHVRQIEDLLAEADHYARSAGRAHVAGADVARAVEARRDRGARVMRRMQEEILRGHIAVQVDGERVGQVNGLSVLEAGEVLFGLPVRISATTRIGEGEVVDIQREVALGGPLHSKGVLILSSFLASRYAARAPLSLAASLVFEQTYGPVEGDSASLAELCALLSSLSGLPVRQRCAVTGSVDQAGRVQAIGGVNEKIEGFFDICKARGLNGSHAVIVPRTNAGQLMLREDVAEAAAQGRFAVYAVDTVDEAMEILTGAASGAPGTRGEGAADTVDGRVRRRLAELLALRRAHAAAPRRPGRRGEAKR